MTDSPIHHVMHDFAIELRKLAYTMPAGHEDRLIHLSERMVQRSLQVHSATGWQIGDRHHVWVFRILFFSPRIAPNTGNAIRMVAATGCELHLVEPLGFDLSEPKVRRAGLDYHDLASVTVHPSLDAAWEALLPARVFAFTAHAQTSFASISYEPGDVLMFGPEPDGLDAATLADAHITAAVRIPMLTGRRSLNLSNAAAVAAYEAWRQQGFIGGI